ncbi:MAG: TRAP transporter small permease [Desulfobacteraceae bacterium]|nr:MAG: TRAP transporter small permease [Desulfobacteraceae bacterium]
MTFLERFQRVNRLISGLMEWIGIFAYVLIMGITCIDVVGAKLFRTPVFGAIDVVMLAQLVAISFAASITLIMGRHVQVEFFVLLLPKRLQVIIDCIVHLLGFALFLLIVWRLFVFGYSFQTGGEETATAYIPLHPFVYGAAVACIPVCLIFLHHFIESIIKVVKK